MGQCLPGSGVLGGLSLPGCAGMLPLPRVRSCSPHGKEAFPAQLLLHVCPGLGAGRGDVPVPSAPDGWGGPAMPQAQSKALGIPHLCHLRPCLLGAICPCPPCCPQPSCLPSPPSHALGPLAPRPRRGGWQGCGQGQGQRPGQPFADREVFLHGWTNRQLILSSGRGLGAGRWGGSGGGRRVLVALAAHPLQSRTVSAPPLPHRESKNKCV